MSDVDDAESEREELIRASISGGQVALIIILVLHAVLLVFYFGWVWSLTTFQHEHPKYTGIGAPPQGFQDRRYDWRWITLSFLSLNSFVPTLLAWLVRRIKVLARVDFVMVLMSVFFFVNIVLLAFLAFTWCTRTFTPQNFANPPEACCGLFGTFPLICRNNAACADFPMPVTFSTDSVFMGNIAGVALMTLFIAVEFILVAAARTYALMALQS